MERMTRRKDKYPCRISQGCPADEWMYELFREYPVWGELCANCPFEAYINRLAELEDQIENMEDDLR